MLEIIKPGTRVNFVGWRVNGFILSGILVGVSIISALVLGGPPMGVDFRGGTEMQIAFGQPVGIERLRKDLEETGVAGISVQKFGEVQASEYLIRFPDIGEDISAGIQEQLGKKFQEEGFELRREEAVGPRVGKELRKKGVLATLIALIGILIYIGWRFELRYGAGAIMALVHDLIIAYGAITIFRYELSLTSLAALLTVAGYSVNDTIVVFDRIRENLRRMSRQRFEEVINVSINENLSRTIITSGTTFLVILAIFLYGGPVLRDFSFVLMVGIIVGTYSSIFIASPILLIWRRKFGKKKK